MVSDMNFQKRGGILLGKEGIYFCLKPYNTSIMFKFLKKTVHLNQNSQTQTHKTPAAFFVFDRQQAIIHIRQFLFSSRAYSHKVFRIQGEEI
jgi:hypothetical protein